MLVTVHSRYWSFFSYSPQYCCTMPPLGEQAMLQIDILLMSTQMLYFTSNVFRMLADDTTDQQLPSSSSVVDKNGDDRDSKAFNSDGNSWEGKTGLILTKEISRRLNVNFLGIRVRSRLKPLVYDSNPIPLR